MEKLNGKQENYHPVKSLVAGFCKNCGQIFYRDGDLMIFSTSYSTPSFKTSIDLENVQNYREWLLFASDLCDNCLPPIPNVVIKDIQEENKRKSEDIAHYHKTKNIYNIPGHINK